MFLFFLRQVSNLPRADLWKCNDINGGKILCVHAVLVNYLCYGIAHIFLLGMLKDCWSMWLRKVSTKGHVLQRYIRDHITDKGYEVQTTELFSKPYTDLIRCVRATYRQLSHARQLSACCANAYSVFSTDNECRCRGC